MIIDGLHFKLHQWSEDERYTVTRAGKYVGQVLFKLRCVEILTDGVLERHGRATKGAVTTAERAEELKWAANTLTEYLFARDLKRIDDTLKQRKREIVVPW